MHFCDFVGLQIWHAYSHEQSVHDLFKIFQKRGVAMVM